MLRTGPCRLSISTCQAGGQRPAAGCVSSSTHGQQAAARQETCHRGMAGATEAAPGRLQQTARQGSALAQPSTPSKNRGAHLEHLRPAVEAQRVGWQRCFIVPRNRLCGAPHGWDVAHLPGAQERSLKAAVARPFCGGARPAGGGVALGELQGAAAQGGTGGWLCARNATSSTTSKVPRQRHMWNTHTRRRRCNFPAHLREGHHLVRGEGLEQHGRKLLQPLACRPGGARRHKRSSFGLAAAHCIANGSLDTKRQI